MTRELIAKKKVYYAKREYAAGERFVAQTDRDAEAMLLAGVVERVPPEKKPSPTVESRAMKAEEPQTEAPTEAPAEAEPMPRRVYRRRDLRAEE